MPHVNGKFLPEQDRGGRDVKPDGWGVVALILASWAFWIVFGILVGCGLLGDWVAAVTPW